MAIPKREEIEMKYEESIGRNIGMLTMEEQRSVRSSKVAIIGAGGVGSWVTVMISKAGFGTLTIVDKDTYEIENIVEQLFARKSTLGQFKSEVARQAAEEHGPYAKVRGLTKEIKTAEDVKEIVEGYDYVISCVDDPVARVVIARAVEQMGITMVVAANIGWKAEVSVYRPGDTSFEEQTRQVSLGKELDEKTGRDLWKQQTAHILAMGEFDEEYAERFLKKEVSYISYMAAPAAFAASIAANEVIKCATGKEEMLLSPRGYAFDMMKMESLNMTNIGRKTYMISNALIHNDMESAVKYMKMPLDKLRYKPIEEKTFSIFG